MGGIPTRWSETLPAHSSSSACGTESPRIADNIDYVNSITKGVVLQHYACWRELRKQDRFLQWRPG